MSFEELAKVYLLKNGASEDQTAAIIEWAKRDEFLSRLDWNGKPNERQAEAFLLAINTVATSYIQEVMPEAWFRHRFAGI